MGKLLVYIRGAPMRAGKDGVELALPPRPRLVKATAVPVTTTITPTKTHLRGFTGVIVASIFRRVRRREPRRPLRFDE
jgi:hypothetical protein